MSHKAFAALVGSVLVHAACPQHAEPVRQLPVESGPKSSGLKKPAESTFGHPDENGRWLRLRDVRFEEGKAFGWRIRLPCRQPVEYVEVMKMPGPSELSREPGELRETEISADHKTLTTHDFAACISGWIEHTWSLTPDDPKGTWEITVSIEGYEPQVFRPRFL